MSRNLRSGCADRGSLEMSGLQPVEGTDPYAEIPAAIAHWKKMERMGATELLLQCLAAAWSLEESIGVMWEPLVPISPPHLIEQLRHPAFHQWLMGKLGAM